MVRTLLLERNLGAASDRSLDLTLMVNCASYGGGMLRCDPLPHRLPAGWFEHAAWRFVRRVAESAGRRDDGWVLLEFDDAQMARACPVPHIFVTPSPGGCLASPQVQRLLDGVGPDGRATLSACVDKIPAPRAPSLIGRMLGRENAQLRLLIAFPTLDMLVEYLDDVGWRSGGSTVRAWDLLGTEARFFLLSVEIDDGIGTRIGVEPYFGELSDRRQARPWARYLGGLVSAELCAPEERAALLDARGLGTALVSLPFVAHRSVSTKLCIDGGDLQVKAYLSLDYQAAAALYDLAARRAVAT